MYLMRLDDASEYMNIEKWSKMEKLLDKYEIKPIYGIIPANEDPDLLLYEKDDCFWKRMRKWQNKGWTPALHGYTHVFETKNGGINPVNKRSEFAGVGFERQCQKIRNGERILQQNGIKPTVFFAPAHTFDENTVKALMEESSIRIISDTIANDVYYYNGIYFIPQQSGRCRKLPFKITTFCYHPNTMNDTEFEKLEKFLILHQNRFGTVSQVDLRKRKRCIIDRVLKQLYFLRRCR